MIQRILDDTLIKCPNCGKSEIAIAWDAFTESQCLDREMRRHYIHITDKKAIKKNSKYNYCCPNCGKYSKVYSLKLEREA